MTDATNRLSNDDAISAILAEWRRRLRGESDLEAREDLRGRRERSLTRALLAVADAPENSAQASESLSKLAMIAALYGVDQPRERLDPGALCEELNHLRQAVRHYVRQKRLEPDVATKRILAFDRALSVAMHAARAGEHQCDSGDNSLPRELEARG
ncbi:MAG TPA: hypothetical protein VGH98_03485 [Gemmatimonadaceae bacterium]